MGVEVGGFVMQTRRGGVVGISNLVLEQFFLFLFSCSVCLTLRPCGLQPARLVGPWAFPADNTGGGCHFLLQGIVATQGSNPHLLHWQVNALQLSHLAQ